MVADLLLRVSDAAHGPDLFGGRELIVAGEPRRGLSWALSLSQNYVCRMRAVEYIRVTQIEDTAYVDELFREYISWWREQMELVHGQSVDDTLIEQAHLNFRKEWPKMLEDPGRLYLVKVDDAPVGVVGLKPVSGSEAEIKRMYLRPACRGRGIAEGLLAVVIRDARSEGFRSIRLDSFDFMTDAHRLYRKVGFQDSEPLDEFEGSDNPVFVGIRLFMKLDLGSR